MTDKKLTDNKIIMTLKGAILNAKGYDSKVWSIEVYKLENALDLINRQQAENENLKVENQSLRSAANSLKMHYEEAQAEIERLQKEVNLVSMQFQDIQERQEESQAEIERLQNTINDILDRQPILVERAEKYAKFKAFKEFAERLKDIFEQAYQFEYGYLLSTDVINTKIDNLVKEMVGEDNA